MGCFAVIKAIFAPIFSKASHKHVAGPRDEMAETNDTDVYA